MKDAKKTPLHAVHVSLGGRMVNFGGWEMPVQYSGVLAEHRATREQAGLFDVSHMGEIEVRGAAAAAVCQYLITNDVGLLREDGQIIYSAMCYPDGGVVDDVLLHRISSEHYLFVVNAANIEKDFAFMQEHAPQGAELVNTSAEWAQLALQGPESQAILQQCTSLPLSELEYYTFRPAETAGIGGYLARTGYTGEDGFEIYVPAGDAEALWQALTEAGTPTGLLPVGLAARDTLRLEAGFPLYGHELSPTISPLEANLGWVVKPEAGDFVGCQALQDQKESGIPRVLISFRLTERGVPREDYPIYAGDEELGFVTSGTQSPMLKIGIGRALVRRGAVEMGDTFSVEIRGRKVSAERVKPPFVPSRVKRKQKS